MRKTGRKARMEEMSAGRIEYLEAARRRVNNRRLRRTALLVAVVAALVIYLTGLVNTSVMVLEDLADSVRIALMPEQGFPQQTGVGNVYQAESLGGSFVVLGEDGCAVLADSGGRLNTISTGYARPAIAAGKNGFVLYNRSGSELRVESRTREMYTRQTEGSIFLCALSNGGELAVATDDVRKFALLTVYDSHREELLTWSLTTAEGVPMRMDFSPDGTQLAIAAVTAQEGQIISNLYLLNLRAGEPQLLASEPGSTPLDLQWMSNDRLLAVYDTHAALFDSSGAVQARREFGGAAVAGVSVGQGGAAVLLGSGQLSTTAPGAGRRPEHPLRGPCAQRQRHCVDGGRLLSFVRQLGGMLLPGGGVPVEHASGCPAPGHGGGQGRAVRPDREYGPAGHAPRPRPGTGRQSARSVKTLALRRPV